MTTSGWLLLAAAFAIHFAFVWRYAVDLPYWDDWSHIPADPSLSWAFALHNEHRYPISRLSVWMLYELNGWNIAVHQILNFLLYGVLVLISVLSLASWVPGWKGWISAAFGVILLSPVAAENHQWATQTGWHTYLLFILASITLLFRAKPSKWHLASGTLMAVGAIYSIAAGIPAVLAVMILWSCFQFSRFRSSPHSWKVLSIEWLMVVVPITAALAAYFMGYSRPEQHHPPAMPWSAAFWNYLGAILGNALALPRTLTDLQPVTGVLSIAGLCLLPLLGLAIGFNRQHLSWPTGYWRLSALIFACLAGVAVVAMGRGNFNIGSAYSGRYAEIALVLIPAGAAAWHWVLRSRPQVCKILLTLLFVGLFCLHGRLFRKFNAYPHAQQQRQTHLELISRYYQEPTTEPYYLPEFWVQMNDYFMDARHLKLSFYRKLPLQKPSSN